MMVSLDGFIEGPDPDLDWALIDEELHRFANEQAREAGAFLYGRRLYDTMAGYWPTANTGPSVPDYEVEFARIWNEKPKLVFSRTLEKVGWNSRLIRDDIAGQVTRLKQRPGGDLALGGADLAATFLQLGLIDEYRPIVHPVVLGGGKPFFPPLDQPLKLRLLETRKFASGVVYLRYEPAA
jgi:dihydrofolate reductase